MSKFIDPAVGIPTTDDRLEQIRAAAYEEMPNSAEGEAFIEGAGWADANPQPTTITRSELAHVAWMLQNLPEDRIAATLPGLLGIEVEDDE